MTTPDIVLIIGVVTTSIVTIINAVSGARSRRLLNTKADAAADQAQIADSKLDVIHVLTNSKLQAALAALDKALSRINELEVLVTHMGHGAAVIPPKE